MRSLLVLVLSPALATDRGAFERPPALSASRGCDRWLGMADGGNDPSARIEVILCPASETAVKVEIQSSSLVSGWTRFALDGEWDADKEGLTLHSARRLEEKLLPGWSTCTDETWKLKKVGPDRLEGRYDSDDCRDHATVWLAREGSVPASFMGEDSTRTPLAPAEPRASGCACSTVSGVPLLAILGGLTVRKRRSNFV